MTDMICWSSAPNAAPPPFAGPANDHGLILMDSPTRMSNMKLMLRERDAAIAGKAAALAAKQFDTPSSLRRSCNHKTVSIPTLKWSDITIGEMLGTGAFSQVYHATVGRNQHKLAAMAIGEQETSSPPPQDDAALFYSDRLHNIDESQGRASRRCWGSLFPSASHPVDDEAWDGIFSSYSERLLEGPAERKRRGAWDMESVIDEALLEDSREVSFDSLSVEKAPSFEMLPSFALKHLDFSKIENQKGFIEGATDIVLEAKLLSCLQHENIIKLFAVAEGPIETIFTSHERGYFLLLSRLYGTLEGRIKEWVTMKNSSESDRLPIALGIARGMCYLHKHSIVYRDLKPQNIGFTSDGIVKIYDFGLSRELPKPGQPPLHTRTGSVRYMAPEVALKKPYGLEVDVYSFAIVVWELCSLKKPYDGMTSTQHASKVAAGNERPNVNLVSSPLVQQLLIKAWDVKPSSRPTFEQIAQQLEPMPKPTPTITKSCKSLPSLPGLLKVTRNRLLQRKVSSNKVGRSSFQSSKELQPKMRPQVV